MIFLIKKSIDVNEMDARHSHVIRFHLKIESDSTIAEIKRVYIQMTTGAGFIRGLINIETHTNGEEDILSVLMASDPNTDW